MTDLACSYKVLKSQKVRAAFIELSLYSEKQNEWLVGNHDSANDKQGSRRGFWRFLFFLSPTRLAQALSTGTPFPTAEKVSDSQSESVVSFWGFGCLDITIKLRECNCTGY